MKIWLALKVIWDKIMKLNAIKLACLLVQATPKAAEHEDAPVTTGVDVVRPKISAKPAKQQVAGKTRPTPKGKSVHAAKPAKTSRAIQGKK